jgi:hypothetical protein
MLCVWQAVFGNTALLLDAAQRPVAADLRNVRRA